MTSAMDTSETILQPQIGMLATVRNRRGIVTSVEPFDGPDGRLHMVQVEYTDPDGPLEDRLVWEREPGASVMAPTALPQPASLPPMPADQFDALVRATRWTAISPYVDPDGAGPLDASPISAPLHGAIQVEDFQLVPLLKALAMPRVSLLLADDVGLGKTIEAGLILTELLLRRRIRRVLIICPASLRSQWRQEMREKFSLDFDVVDADSTHALRKRFDLNANPWRIYPRIIASYHYLRQADILEQFRAACSVPAGSPHLPWDLLVVDEAHNLAPAGLGEESDLSRMLGLLAPRFEHKLFLTATPHNGHTRSFSGLLERLDPVRFSRTAELTTAERARISEVVVRRLKREINEQTKPPRFGERFLSALPVVPGPGESTLSGTFEAFRKRVHHLVRAKGDIAERAGAFAVEVLGKRLLSCPVAFADSWHRYLEGTKDTDGADAADVTAAERALGEDLADDRETESRTAHAARTVGAWLRPFATDLAAETAAIGAALQRLGLERGGVPVVERKPAEDARFARLTQWIDANLRAGNQWRSDERLIVFTEYKTTLDYLQKRLTPLDPDGGRIQVLYGGMDDERDAIKAAFNDPADPVRVLVATDAASEGLNLQETARYLLHYDIPWNPSRLEQRNGRLDRHGQGRDVYVHHFASESDADLRFLSLVVRKAHKVREDLGSAGEIFDAAFQKRFVRGADAREVEQDFERDVDQIPAAVDLPRDARVTSRADGGTSLSALEALKRELDLSPETLRETLDVALAVRDGRPRLEPPDAKGRTRLVNPIPGDWAAVIDETLRVKARRGERGALPGVVFDPGYFIGEQNGRPVFRPSRDTSLLHLGHPLFHRVLATFAQARFPGTDRSTSRWLVRRGGLPEGIDVLILLTVEELAVNELRETFHHWLRTLRLPVRNGILGDALPHVAAQALREGVRPAAKGDEAIARDVWLEVEADVRNIVRTAANVLTSTVAGELQRRRDRALADEQERFQRRQGEVSKLITEQTIQRLERELKLLAEERKKARLWGEDERLQVIAQSERAKEEEIQLRKRHYEELQQQLADERERLLKRIVPLRHTLSGAAQVLPVAVEIRLS